MISLHEAFWMLLITFLLGMVSMYVMLQPKEPEPVKHSFAESVCMQNIQYLESNKTVAKLIKGE